MYNKQSQVVALKGNVNAGVAGPARFSIFLCTVSARGLAHSLFRLDNVVNRVIRDQHCVPTHIHRKNQMSFLSSTVPGNVRIISIPQTTT